MHAVRVAAPGRTLLGCRSLLWRAAEEGSVMSAVDVVLQVFRSVEERNPQLAAEVYHDDLEFH